LLFDSQETLLETMWLREQVWEAGEIPMIPPSEIVLPLKNYCVIKAKPYVPDSSTEAGTSLRLTGITGYINSQFFRQSAGCCPSIGPL
jgi:hypothetical protein